MKKQFIVSIVLMSFTAFLSLSSTGQAKWESEPFQWGPWNLKWEINDQAGLALRNVSYQDELVLAKASLPVIRVNSERCGPFQHRITPRQLQNIPNCGNDQMCIESHTINDLDWLELGVHAKIGQYHLYQAWYLSEDGQIQPSVQSWNVSCHSNHDYHAYWRLDFDIGGPDQDQVFVLDLGSTEDQGWGPGWRKYVKEVDDIKSSDPTHKRVWFVRDYDSSHGVWIIPGPADGLPDDFSDRDISIRSYKTEEEGPWPFGAGGDLNYDDNENIQETNLVFWYIGHLPHKTADGDLPPRNWMGPLLKIQR